MGDQLVFRRSVPGWRPVQQLVEDEAQRPDIAFRSVLLSLEDLNGHVERRAHNSTVLESLAIGLFGEAKVTDLDHAIVNEDVFWF